MKTMILRLALSISFSIIALTAQAQKKNDGMVLIHSKGKSFNMGQQFPGKRWTYTFPVHQVSFTYNFLMDTNQVSQQQFLQLMGRNPTLHPGDLNRPIDNITWYDAVLYCNKRSKLAGLDTVYTYSGIRMDSVKQHVDSLVNIAYNFKKKGYRLLTSAEYEFVTRAGTTTTYFWGDSASEQDKSKAYAWSVLNSNGHPHAVGTLKANAFGVHDITGNLWMWCNDWYEEGPYPETPQINQMGPPTGRRRIGRGAAFKNDVDGHERSAYHWQWYPREHNFEVGFRVARTD